MQTWRRMLTGVRERAISTAITKTFHLWQRIGVHVTPRHFYGPVPDTRELPPALWERGSELVGIDLRVDQQLELVRRLGSRFGAELEELPRAPSGRPGEFYLENDLFGWLDATIYHCMLREFRPQRVIEVGSGLSTLLAIRALERNDADGASGAITAIDPYPQRGLLSTLTERADVLMKRVQDVPLSRFEALEANDILFIDSSHVLKIGSDVQFLYLEVIPRLTPGVLVHAHDIFLPSEYPEDWVRHHQRFWNEQYLLQAFLSFNDVFEVVWSGSLLHRDHPEVLDAAFSIYDPSHRPPGSFWFRRSA